MIVFLMMVIQTALAQQVRSFTFELPAPVADATPMFGPVHEREWAPGWSPRFLHPVEAAQQEGAVFTTAGHGGTRLWVITEYDPRGGRVGYLVSDPDYLVTEIKISVVSAGRRTSRATVTYRRSALTERANEQVHALTDDWAAAQALHWGAAITAALKRRAGHE